MADNIVRGIDKRGDWCFGNGYQDYKQNIFQVAQRIATHIRSWYHDCFFDFEFGIDWKNYLGSYSTKKLIALSVRRQIQLIDEVVKINDVSVVLDEDRLLTLTYNVNTIYGILEEKLSLVY